MNIKTHLLTTITLVLLIVVSTCLSQTLQVIRPNGGEQWVVSSNEEIMWSSSLSSGEKIRIEVSRDGGSSWEVVDNKVPVNSTFNWQVSGPQSNSCLMRITSVTYPSVTDTSDDVFSVRFELRGVDILDDRILTLREAHNEPGIYSFWFLPDGQSPATLAVSGAFTQDARGNLIFTGSLREDDTAVTITTTGKLKIKKKTGEVYGKLNKIKVPALQARVKFALAFSSLNEVTLTITYKKNGQNEIVRSVTQNLVCDERGADIVIEQLAKVRDNIYAGAGTLNLPGGLKVPVTIKARKKKRSDGSLIYRYKFKGYVGNKVVCKLKIKTLMPSPHAESMVLLNVGKRKISYVKKVYSSTVWLK